MLGWILDGSWIDFLWILGSFEVQVGGQAATKNLKNAGTKTMSKKWLKNVKKKLNMEAKGASSEGVGVPPPPGRRDPGWMI